MRWVWLFVGACSYAPQAGPPADAPPPDAFDPASQCPTDYGIELNGQASRYRILTNGQNAWEHHDDCNDDFAGRTHLAVIDSLAELDLLEMAIDAVGGIDSNKAWLGAVQQRDQIGTGIGWINVTGGPLITDGWDDGEPNDGADNTEGNAEENFAGIERNRDGLVDFPTNDEQGGVCECDGKPVDATAALTIDSYR